jgi:hypothetical protein
MLLDFNNIYNAIYLFLAILAVIESRDPLIYALLLLDIIKRSVDLQNVIAAITTNASGLLKLAFLGFVIIYIFSIIAYSEF